VLWWPASPRSWPRAASTTRPWAPRPQRSARVSRCQYESLAGYAHSLTAGGADAALTLSTDEQQSICAAFDLSYRRLPAAGQRLFRLLGSGSDSSVTVARVAALADLPVPEARRVLDGLAAAHLVEQCEWDRFSLHHLVHRFAAGVSPVNSCHVVTCDNV
jgi:hypothetical protein